MDANKKRKQYGKRPSRELFRKVCEANAGIIGGIASTLGGKTIDCLSVVQQIFRVQTGY